MIISFSLENWMSFRNRVTFSMVASRERQHGDRVSKLGKYQTRVLPIAALYGGNASGKTNFFKAMNFAKRLVAKGTQPDSLIPLEPFRLGADGTNDPSHFAFELLIDEIIYDFSFAVTRKAVLQERLVKIGKTSEKVLYYRHKGTIEFDASLGKDEFLRFAFQGTRDNQLFLTNSVSQKVENFRPVYDWFKNTLELVAPDSRFEPYEIFLDENHPHYSTMNLLLAQLDTGITHLGIETIPVDNLKIPDGFKTMLMEDFKRGNTVKLLGGPFKEASLVTSEAGEMVTKKLFAYHAKDDGTEAKFELCQESDGSQRVIDLLPTFLDLADHLSRKVYIIDEIDRSLHTLLTRSLLEAYLGTCSTETRSQLLFTTHDVLLMDQQLLRRDEMWVAERDSRGASNLYSFAEYKDVRYDKDIRKSYLQGRLGGIPRIMLREALGSRCNVEDKYGND
ncbi:MAG: ATP-binding protein [Deltaproteobacteria bacterium]|nr:ATP-binding protein [Deltaproteobacteria bacterium]